MWSESPPRSRLRKEEYADADVIEKACAMLRAGGSDAFVSDYLGMKAGQVAAIREGLLTNWRGKPPEPCVGADGVEARREADARLRDAKRGSAALLAAIRRYLGRHHPVPAEPAAGEAA